MATTKCKSCGAAIVWAKTINGKMIPLNEPAPMRFVLTREGGQLRASAVPTYDSHFLTCPNAAEHRKSRGRG